MANVSPFVARPARRLAAGTIDLVLATMAAVFVLVIVDHAEYSTNETRLALMVYALYHASFFRLWDGQTPGLRTFDIRAVSRTGGIELSPRQTLVRAGFRPLLLYVLDWATNLMRYSPDVAAIIVAAPLAAELGMMFTLATRQTLSDLVSGTLVVNVPPPQPHRAPAAPMYSRTDAEFGVRPRPSK
jgi:uncharacterized RDD family membrane protein YckC